jgi:protocatechuate 3,4-dioxygenase beta subunit
VEPGTYTLRASAQHLASGVVPEVVVEKDRETNDLYVSLGEGGAITGTVYDEAGQPVGGASLRIQPVRKNVRMFGDFGLRVTADEKGVYLVEHLDPGRYRVIRAGAGNAGMSMTIVMSGSKPTKDDDPGDDGTSILVQEGQVARFDVRSATTAGVRGVVTDPDGKPLSEMIQLVEVDVDRPEAEKGSPVLRFPHMARSDKEGKFEFRDLAPGTYRLEVAGVEKQVTISAGRFETVTLRVVHSKVEGVVLDESGRPVEGARVYLRSTGRSSGGISFLGFGGGNSGKTDKQGRFAIERANPGHYRVLATKNNLRTRGEEIEVVPGQSLQNVRVVLVEATEVRIRVRDDEGAPVAGASFFFRSADDTGAQGGRTDKQGEGVVRLLPGDYTLNVSRPGGKSVEQEILVGRGNRQDVEVPLR